MPNITFKETDKGFKKFKREIWKMGLSGVRAGIIGSEGKRADGVITHAEVAAAHEYGTRTIPQRSWLRSTVDEKRINIHRFITGEISAMVSGKIDALKALNGLGLFAQDMLRHKIANMNQFSYIKPLSQKTIDRKKSKKILIDTGAMQKAISYELMGRP